jgi:hypothetical protein
LINKTLLLIFWLLVRGDDLLFTSIRPYNRLHKMPLI